MDRPDGRHQDRNSHRVAQEPGRGIDLTDVAEHSWPKGQTVQSLTIPAQCGFRFRSAAQIVPDVLCDVASGFDDDFMKRIEFHAHLVFPPVLVCRPPSARKKKPTHLRGEQVPALRAKIHSRANVHPPVAWTMSLILWRSSS